MLCVCMGGVCEQGSGRTVTQLMWVTQSGLLLQLLWVVAGIAVQQAWSVLGSRPRCASLLCCSAVFGGSTRLSPRRLCVSCRVASARGAQARATVQAAASKHWGC